MIRAKANGSAATRSTLHPLVVIVLAAALGILGSWVVYRRERISRRASTVDLEAVHTEAEKVGNDAFFKRVQRQLEERRKESSKDSGGH